MMFSSNQPLSFTPNMSQVDWNATRIPETPSTTSTCSASVGSLLLLGFSNNFEEFNGVDLLNFVKEHSATLNFPQKLMLMLTHVDRENAKSGKSSDSGCISWSPDGHSFVIRDRAAFCKGPLAWFFREAKFSSFTRKLYRWGFRQICIPKGHNKKDRNMIFGHEHFQRDDKSLMANMRSVTAAGTRRAITALNARKKSKKGGESSSSASESSSCSISNGSNYSSRCSSPAPSSPPMSPLKGMMSSQSPCPVSTSSSDVSLLGLLGQTSSQLMGAPAASPTVAPSPAPLQTGGLPVMKLLDQVNQAALMAPLQSQLAYLQLVTQIAPLLNGGLSATSAPAAAAPQPQSVSSTDGLLGELQKLAAANANAVAVQNRVRQDAAELLRQLASV